ncbi:MAG TPA: signal peptidase I [Streptosporangiaceae bacterium]|nr:signal peptidase I [Streptosporangiaceae bacterium]
MTNDDQDDGAPALTQADRLGRPASDHKDQAGTAPGQERGGPPMAGTAARDETAGPLDEPGEPDEPGTAKKRRRPRSFWRELPVLILIALVIALVIKSFVVQAFFIPSSSMENTLDIGDKVLVNKLVYHFRSIQPGDIVVFDGDGSWEPAPGPAKASSDPVVRLFDVTLDPLYHSILGLFGTAPGQTDFIKRVIGVPGDHVACCTASGDVTVNGVALQEHSYLYPGNVPSAQRFSITVPPGRLWVMGDHRAVSWDSRGHMQDPGDGTIPENMVIGRAFMIVWPPSRWRILSIPSTFGQPGIVSGASAVAGAAGPYLPVGAGFAGAVPLTLLQRRLRRRLPARRGLPARRRPLARGRLRRGLLRRR